MGNSFRPPTYTVKAWAKLSEEKQLEAIADYTSRNAGVAIEVAPLGLACLRTTSTLTPAAVLAWSNAGLKLEEDIGLEDYCIPHDRVHQHGHFLVSVVTSFIE